MESSLEGASARQPHPTCSTSHSGSNQPDSRFVIAKCRRNTDVSTNQNATNVQETTEESESEECRLPGSDKHQHQPINFPMLGTGLPHAQQHVSRLSHTLAQYGQKVLATYCRAGKLGAAYYTLQTGELFILEEIVDRPPEYQMFLNLFRQVDPSRILLEGKSQGTFVQAVKKTIFSNDDDEGTCKLIFISSREYNFEACKRRIYSLSLPNEPPNCSEEERSLFLRTVVDFSQRQSVHALGALLRYLDMNWSAISLDLHSRPEFMSLRIISLADIVTLDEDTYRGLQIFSALSHPSGFKRGARGSSREGLSLYQMFKRCSSTVGQTRMRVLMQHPTSNIETLTQRQEVVSFFMRPQSDTLARNICSSLRFIRNVNGILAKMKALSAKAYQWKSLYNIMYNAVLICEMCEGVAGNCTFLDQLAASDNTKIYEMALYMNRIIDFDLTKSEGKFTVKAGVDPELDMKKQTMASLHGLMSDTARVELSRLPAFVAECTMLYMPHLGYLLGVRAWPGMVPGEKELPDMKFMFQNNDYIHYKSKGCEELDVMIGDAYPEIVAHETRIMMRLTAILLQHLHSLAGLVDKCAELDCLIAMSKVSKEFSFVRPLLVRDKVLSISQGRHPLAALSCDSFVPNDAETGEEAGYVKILTGPNSSGKSVYMKQIGLIVYLAHIGSGVPAARAAVGVVSHILTRIQSAECVAAHMSAFLIDLRQMALALRESTSNSLIIIDEFGKGTSEVDGLALLAACLNTFLFQGGQCPHLFLSTHFLDVHKYIVSTPIVRFLRFEHTVQDGEPVFLFRVVEGSADCSFAHQVASASGIEDTVVARAKQVLDCFKNNTLPPENKKITLKLMSIVDIIKNELLSEDI